MNFEFKYITFDPEILNGKPIIKGTRVSVQMILEWIASGASIDQICDMHPRLAREAIQEALKYASYMNKNEIIREIKISA
jgi:uncharacterized protein (DUF433 family)